MRFMVIVILGLHCCFIAGADTVSAVIKGEARRGLSPSALTLAGNFEPMFCSDFAGVKMAISRGDPFNGMPCTETRAETVDQFARNPYATMSLLSRTEYGKAWIKNFHYLLVHMEAFAMTGDALQFEEYSSAIAGCLRQYEEHLSVYGDGVLRINRFRLEYALARIVNDRSGGVLPLSPDSIRKILPALSGEAAGLDALWRKKQDTFRVMLLIGSAIERSRSQNKKLPESISLLDSISSDELLDAWGNRIKYVSSGSDWKLYSSGGTDIEDDVRLTVVIPELDRLNGRLTPQVWFSSNFSALRVELFEGRVINKNVPLYECSLQGHSVRIK